MCILSYILYTDRNVEEVSWYLRALRDWLGQHKLKFNPNKMKVILVCKQFGFIPALKVVWNRIALPSKSRSTILCSPRLGSYLSSNWSHYSEAQLQLLCQ